MNDIKLYGKCFTCKKNRFFVRKRKIRLMKLNKEVTSRERFCTPCFKGILSAQENGILQ